ncbi:hypothetical protein [Longimicrobium sp.]|uniref:hypothetical protein n=1 Tax=Longimicrobium sp. TaxID=2029185 RepID=UPI002C8F9233|nr:hypothetical protein [Longimicrobium sp.]HSU16025.1 hypothetical protein [Longimicrobium sp.]
MNRKLLAALAAACLYAAPALAQSQQPPATPFGLRMGMTLADLARFHPEARRTPGVYLIDGAPAAQPEFREYMIVVSPHQGLCKVVGMGRIIETPESGEALRASFDRLESLLAGKYGDGNQIDDLKEGSPWSGDRDWMMSLRQRDRTYRTTWSTADGDALPPNLQYVEIDASAASEPGLGSVLLTYEFTNFAQCRGDLDAQRGNAF